MSDILLRSKEVLRISGISPRRLQYWDEEKLVSPARDGRNRVYTMKQTLLLMLINSMLDKGMTYNAVVAVLPGLKKRLWALKDGESTYLMVAQDGGCGIYKYAHSLVFALAECAAQPCWLIDIGSHWSRLAAESSNGTHPRPA